MKIKTIQVTAGRTFNHPHETYSNLRPEITLTAEIGESEDPAACARTLQAQAEGLVEDHKQGMLRSIEELHQLTERQAEMRGLRQQLERAQDRINELRKHNPELALADAPTQ